MRTITFLFLASLIFVAPSSQLIIDETRRVIEAHDMCHGQAILSEISVDAARLARFSPTKISGIPVKVTGVIRYRYVHRPW